MPDKYTRSTYDASDAMRGTGETTSSQLGGRDRPEQEMT